MGETERPMSAYYYWFSQTGDDSVDKILSAVACAGKSFHSTEQWFTETTPPHDHTGKDAIDWIQNAANEAADSVKQARRTALEDAAKLCTARVDAVNASELSQPLATAVVYELRAMAVEIRTLMERDDE